MRAGLGDPGQPGAGHGCHGEVQAAVAGAQAPGPQCRGRAGRGGHAACSPGRVPGRACSAVPGRSPVVPAAAGGLRKTSTSSCTIRCQGSPRRRALRALSSWKNEGRAISWPSRSPASRATYRAAGTRPARGAGGQHGRRQVGQLAVLPPGAGGDHGQPAGAQQEAAAGHDLGEALQQLVQPPAGEVGRVVAVAVVVLADPAGLAVPLLGLDLAVHAGAVGRRGDDQRGLPAVPAGSRLASWRASPRITSAVPTAPWRRAWATLAAATEAQRSSYSTPSPSRPRWTASTRVVPIPHIGSATRSPGLV